MKDELETAGLALDELTTLVKEGTVKCSNKQLQCNYDVLHYVGGTQLLAFTHEGTVQHIQNRSCSAGLKGLHNFVLPNTVEYIAVATIVKTFANENKELCLEFIEWFINESPYSKCIVPTTKEDAYDRGIILSTKHQRNLVVGAAIAWRVLWEYTAVVKNWKSFVNIGVNKSAAFVLAHCGKISDGKLDEYIRDGHCAVNGGFVTKQYIKNFCTGTVHKKELDYIDSLTYDYTIAKAWGGGGRDWLYLANHNAPKRVKSKMYNPFAKGLKLYDLEKVGGGIEQAVLDYVNEALELK